MPESANDTPVVYHNIVVKKPRTEIIKRLLAVMSIIFVLFVLPATVNLALSSQDLRNKAAIVSENSSDNTIQTQNQSSQNQFPVRDLFMKIYPFIVGLVLIIWGALIFFYIGSKFKHKT